MMYVVMLKRKRELWSGQQGTDLTGKRGSVGTFKEMEMDIRGHHESRGIA